MNRCHNTFFSHNTSIEREPIGKNRIIRPPNSLYIYSNSTCPWRGGFPKWVYVFVVHYTVVRSFGCSKPTDDGLLSHGHWVAVLDCDSVECSTRGILEEVLGRVHPFARHSSKNFLRIMNSSNSS